MTKKSRATNLPYRVLFNQDCDHVFYATQEPFEPRHVDEMVDRIAQGGADVLLVNPSAQLAYYPSKVWQTAWDGFVPGRREFFGPIPDDQVPERERALCQMKRLVDQGCDYLARALARCRADGIVPGVSVRMNDMHDAPWKGSHFHSRFYTEHPEYQLSYPSTRGWSGTALNYEHAAVREHHLTLIRELAQDYDVEVLELDFLRFTRYVPSDGDLARKAATMTGFVREVRAILRGTGRAIAFIPRVAATPAAALELGFDVAAWAREGLVDGVTVGHFLSTGWNMAVEQFRERIGSETGLYVCTDASADRRDGLPTRLLPVDADLLRGFAAAYLASGADGIALFNFFALDPTDPPPLYATLRQLSSLDGLRGQPKTYLITAGTSACETDAPVQVPVAMAHNQSREFEIRLAAEPAHMQAELRVILEGATSADQLWLHFDAAPLGHALAIEDGPTGQRRARTAQFDVPIQSLRDGLNRLVLRNQGHPLTVLGIEVHVQPAGLA